MLENAAVAHEMKHVRKGGGICRWERGRGGSTIDEG
jgi:hypothetical protein